MLFKDILNLMTVDYRDLIADDWKRRKDRNKSLSLRSYSRLLGISPSSLSLVMRKKSHFSIRGFLEVAKKLEFANELINDTIELLRSTNHGSSRGGMKSGRPHITVKINYQGSDPSLVKFIDDYIIHLKKKSQQYPQLKVSFGND